MDIWTLSKRSEVMSRISGRGNKATEQRLAALLKQAGITGWRRHLRLPGKPDFSFPKHKVAVFVDGCFWHGCPKCYMRPKTNQKFWDKKHEYDKVHDRRVARQLRQRGWRVIRIWQHSLRKFPNTSLKRIRDALNT